jgi:hypothetical protein
LIGGNTCYWFYIPNFPYLETCATVRCICTMVGGTMEERCVVGSNTYTGSQICSQAGADYVNDECKWRATETIPGYRLCDHFYNHTGQCDGVKHSDPSKYTKTDDEGRTREADFSSGTCEFDRVKAVTIKDLCENETYWPEKGKGDYKSVTNGGGKILYELCRVKRKAWQ